MNYQRPTHKKNTRKKKGLLECTALQRCSCKVTQHSVVNSVGQLVNIDSRRLPRSAAEHSQKFEDLNDYFKRLESNQNLKTKSHLIVLR
jgi:hypothetical protein